MKCSVISLLLATFRLWFPSWWYEIY